MKKLTVLGLSLAGIALAEVYIVPPDIDRYKQKTDQVFYDMYQNPNSAIRRGIERSATLRDSSQSDLLRRLQTVRTDQRIASDVDIKELPLLPDFSEKADVVGGSQTRVCGARDKKTGMWVRITWNYDEKGIGNASINWGGADEVYRGTGIIVLKKFTSSQCANSAYIGKSQQCVEEIREGRKLIVNKACTLATIMKIKEKRERPSYRCGKSTCYGSWTNWNEVESTVAEVIPATYRQTWWAKTYEEGAETRVISYVERREENRMPSRPPAGKRRVF